MEDREITQYSPGEFQDVCLRIESKQIVKEVQFAVDHVAVSDTLESSDDIVYLNIRTKERRSYCVQLSFQGFRVVSHTFDSIDSTIQPCYYETIYALLDSVSESYRNSFGNALIRKLQSLPRDSDDDVATPDDVH